MRYPDEKVRAPPPGMSIQIRATRLTVLSAVLSVAVLVSLVVYPSVAILIALVDVLVALLALFPGDVSGQERREARAASPQRHFGTGSYEILEKLSEGGMGEVYSARHIELGRMVAIKNIKPIRVHEEDQARFRREARVLSGLSSPHTINVFDAGVRDDGTLFYVMELLDGLDLSRLVDETGPQRPERVIHVLRQVSLSLGEAHARGLVHRDLKPANIMLCRYGNTWDFTKVLDFGLVKGGAESEGSEPITHSGELPGTPAFLAPESILGERIDARADLYSLGAVAYYLLTGSFLFPERSPMRMVAAQIHEAPPRASESCPFDMPRELDDLIARLLSKDRNLRPASADEVIETLEILAVSSPWTREQAKACWERVPPRSDLGSLPPALPSDPGAR